MEDIDGTLDGVNAAAARQLWMDFDVWSYDGYRLVVSGSTDQSYHSELRVIFEGVCWACMRFQGWHSDTSQPVVLRVEGKEAYAVNERFQIEEGHHLFKFVAEDVAEPMWIAAQRVTADFTRISLGDGSRTA